MKAVLFDLDETLILDEPVVRNAFFYTARSVFTDAERASALAERAAWYTTQLWQSLPRTALEYAKRIGHSAFEGLWAVYNPRIEAEALLETALQQIRIEVWERALSDLDTSADAAVLAKRWRNLRSRYPIYPDADELLARLYGRYKLGVVTNGVAGLQRQKWHGSGLENWFDAVAISGEVGIGKPERGIFESVATALQVELCDCVMVGDNSERDVQGGINAGMKTVWLERGFKPKTVNANFETKTLLEILPWLEQLA